MDSSYNTVWWKCETWDYLLYSFLLLALTCQSRDARILGSITLSNCARRQPVILSLSLLSAHGSSSAFAAQLAKERQHTPNHEIALGV